MAELLAHFRKEPVPPACLIINSVTYQITSNLQPQDDQDQQGVKVHRVERSQAFVRRSLRLPEYADLSKVQVCNRTAFCAFDCTAMQHTQLKAIVTSAVYILACFCQKSLRDLLRDLLAHQFCQKHT